MVNKKTVSEMTSPNLNKFMRANINLNSQVLAKNTSEIVSTCIGRLYKQVPNKFKNGLQQIKIAAERKENRAPLRMFMAQDGLRQQTAVGIEPRLKNPLPSNVDHALLLHTVMNVSRKRFLSNSPVNGKLLKTPTYKIYPRRRYGSSASSSTGSLLRRQNANTPGAKRIPSKHAVLQLKKSYSMIHGEQKRVGRLDLPNLKVASLVVPQRNQHMNNYRGSVPMAMEVSSNIQRDLMAIDELLKNRLRIGEPAKVARRLAHTKVWQHPPAPQLVQSRNEQIFANTELQNQCRRLQTFTKAVGTRKPLEKVSRIQSVGATMKSPVISKPKLMKPPTCLMNERRDFTKRKPLSELKSPLTPELWSNYKLPLSPTTTTSVYGKLQKPYKINGRIAPTSTATLASASAMSTTAGQHYNRNRYAKLSTNVH